MLDAREGASHEAWSADPDVRHESQPHRGYRRRGVRTWWRIGSQPAEAPFIGPLDWRATGHRPNGGMENL